MNRPQMFPARPHTLFLSADQLEALHQKIVHFAEHKGFRVEHSGLLDTLQEAGAHVDRDTQIVTFDRSLIDDALRAAPLSFTLCAPNPENDLPFPHPRGAFYARTNTGGTQYLDPGKTDPRPVTLADAREWAALAGRLENIDFCAFPSVSDVPPPVADIEALRTVLASSTKHVWIQPYSSGSLDYLVELATIAGGGEDALRSRPTVSIIACALTPYTFKPMDAEIILKACRYGIPIHACSLPSAGGTSPITPIGSAFVAAAEILAMTVMAQLLRPGHPVIGTPLMFAMDMRTGRVGQSSPEALRAAAAAVQLVKYIAPIPVHTYGAGSDSPILDEQVGIEAALLGSVVALAGADILGAAGQFQVATAISPLQLIVDNEVLGALKAIVRTQQVDDDALGWEAIMSAEHGGTFLTADHTYDHCRDVWTTRLLSRDPPDVWRERRQGSLFDRALAAYARLTAEPAPTRLSEEVAATLGNVVARARASLL